MGLERRGGGVGTDFGGWASDTAQRVLRLEQRRQRIGDPGGIVEFGRGGWRSKVLCYVPDEVVTNHDENEFLGIDTFPQWDFSLDFKAECAFHAVLVASTTWNEFRPELAKSEVLFSWDVLTLDPGDGIVQAADTRLIAPDSNPSLGVEVVTLPNNGAFVLPEGVHSIQFSYSMNHLNLTPSTPSTYEHTTSASLYVWLVAVEDRVPDDGPDCFIDPGGGGEG